VSVSGPDAVLRDSVEATDIEVGLAMTGQAGLNSPTRRTDTAKDYSGPPACNGHGSSSFIDVYRFALEQFAGITASSITAPALRNMNFGAAASGGGDSLIRALRCRVSRTAKIDLRKWMVVFQRHDAEAARPDKSRNLGQYRSFDVDSTSGGHVRPAEGR